MLVLDADGTFLYQYDITARTVTQLETDAFFNVRAVRFCRDGSIMYAVGNEMHRLDPNSWKIPSLDVWMEKLFLPMMNCYMSMGRMKQTAMRFLLTKLLLRPTGFLFPVRKKI